MLSEIDPANTFNEGFILGPVGNFLIFGKTIFLSSSFQNLSITELIWSVIQLSVKLKLPLYKYPFTLRNVVTWPFICHTL